MAKILIQHNAERLHHVDGVMLMPGTNEVDSEQFAGWMLLPAFKALVDAEVIVSLEASTGKELVAADFAKLSEKDALEMVANTVRAELLEGWLATEKRKKVAAALTAQLAAIKPTPKKEE